MDDSIYHKITSLGNGSSVSIAPPLTIVKGRLRKVWSKKRMAESSIPYFSWRDSIPAMQFVAQHPKEGIGLAQVFQYGSISLLAQAAKSVGDAHPYCCNI